MSRRTQVFTTCLNRARTLAADHERWARVHADLDYCATGDRFRIAVRQMQDARPGLPGAADYSGKTSSGGRSDSVPERLLLTEDRTEGDRRAMDHALIRMDFALRDPVSVPLAITSAHQIRRLVDVWCTRAASDLDRRKALEENRKLEGCQHHQTANIFEPVYKAQTDVAGRLSIKTDLCEPCYDHVRRYDRLPSGEWIDRRQRTGKSEGERVTVRGKVKA